MLDDLRNYLQMASGLTEATTGKAKEVVTGLLSQGMSLSSKAMPAPEMMGQVQELADDLVSTSRNNREMLVGMIRAEVDRAVGRMGFVREDELAALRRHVQRVEKQLADLQDAADARPTYPAEVVEVIVETPAPTEPAGVTPPADSPVAQPAESPVEQAAESPAEQAAEPAPEADAPVKKKKRKIVVDESAES